MFSPWWKVHIISFRLKVRIRTFQHTHFFDAITMLFETHSTTIIWRHKQQLFNVDKFHIVSCIGCRSMIFFFTLNVWRAVKWNVSVSNHIWWHSMRNSTQIFIAFDEIHIFDVILWSAIFIPYMRGEKSDCIKIMFRAFNVAGKFSTYMDTNLGELDVMMHICTSIWASNSSNWILNEELFDL